MTRQSVYRKKRKQFNTFPINMRPKGHATVNVPSLPSSFNCEVISSFLFQTTLPKMH